ncbi:ABC transporter permease [Clostridium isatidis]|uniref:ABC3 transporter permease C-terminal domain-containing protein n=1 Tax=Clostridium isatidis TaxID=182773 RepID=A0A343JA02_9CLOT|nr:FtsX-like permease family protein [Clostridium isatidis]ASW42360.1 hypothetical protein BEN51_02320 [Clostridium isatidis]NLZ34655.1 FtsX-like permease family protein [Clostridiales bacterium]
MNIILRHISRNILENKFRSLLIIFSLIISTIVIYLNFNIKDDLVLQYKAVMEGSYKEYDIFITKNNVNNQTDAIYDMDTLDLSGMGVKEYFGVSRVLGLYSYNNSLINVYMYGTDIDLLEKENLISIDQNTNEYKEKGNIVISKNVAEYYNLDLNDKIKIKTNDEDMELTIAAIADIKGMYLQESGRIMAFTSRETLGEIYDRPSSTYGTYIKLEDYQESKDFIEKFNQKNEGFLAVNLHDETAIKNEVNTISQMLIFALAAVIILVFYINRSMLRLVLAKRVSIFGTIRSIGATKNFVNRLFLYENIIYGILGGGIGTLIGILIRQPVARMFNSYGSENMINNTVNFKYIIYSLFFTVLLQITISYFEIIKINKNNIKELIFNKISTAFHEKKLVPILGGGLLLLSFLLYKLNTNYNLLLGIISFLLAIAGSIGIIPTVSKIISQFLVKINNKLSISTAELAGKNTKNSKSANISIKLITIVLSIMMIIAIIGFSISSVFKDVKETFNGDIQLTNIAYNKEYYEGLKEIKGVETLDFIYYKFFDLKLNNKENNLAILGFNEAKNGIKDISGKLGSISESEILVDEYYALRNEIEIGSIISLESEEFDKLEFKVAGFIDSSSFISSRNVVVISEEKYIKEITDVPIAIEIESNIDVKDLKHNLINKLIGTGIKIQTIEEFLNSNKEDIDTLLSLVILIIGMAAFIGILGVISNQLISFYQRKKEFAIYYSVAMSKKQIAKVFFYEIAYTFFIACIIGGGLGVWLSKILEQILFSIGEYINVKISFMEVSAIILGMFSLLLLSNLFMIRNILKLNVVEEIKCE